MTVARDAVLEFATFTTTSPTTLSFTPTGTPRGITVLIAHGAVLTDLILGVTYGGVTMQRVYFGSLAGAEGGNVYAYFLGSGIPTGTQTVSITHTATSTVKWAVVQSVTAAADTELGPLANILNNSWANPALLLDSGPVEALRVGMFWSGLDDIASLAPLAGMEALTTANTHDYGTVVACLAEQTTASTGQFTLGFTATAEDSNTVAFGIQEVVTDGFPHVTAPILSTLPGPTAHPVIMPPVVAVGDLLLIVLSTSSTTVTTPGGWTLLSTLAPSFELNIFYRIADGTEGGTTVTITTGSSISAAQTFRITDWHGTTPPEAGTPANASSTLPNPPSLTPSWGAADTLWMAVCNAGASGLQFTDYPDSYGAGTASFRSGTGATAIGAAFRKLNAASDDPATFTTTPTSAWIAQTVAIRPVVVIPPVTGTLGGVQAAQTAQLSGTVTNPAPPTPASGNRMGGTGAIRKPPRG